MIDKLKYYQHIILLHSNYKYYIQILLSVDTYSRHPFVTDDGECQKQFQPNDLTMTLDNDDDDVFNKRLSQEFYGFTEKFVKLQASGISQSVRQQVVMT